MNIKKTAIIIVNYRTPEVTVDCLNSISKHVIDNQHTKIFLVDNSSQDNSLSIFNAYIASKNSLKIELISSSENKGFSAGNNLGIQKALSEGYDYFLLLNNDTVLSCGLLDVLHKFLVDTPDCDIIACCVNNKNNKRELFTTRTRPTFSNLIFLYQSPFWNKKWFPGFKKHFMLDKNRNESFSVFIGTASCMLLNKKFFQKTGLLDENTFLFFEEFIIGEKARDANLKVYFLPSSEIIHLGGESTKKAHAMSYIEFCKSEKYYMEKYRNFSKCKIFIAKIIRTTGFLLRSLVKHEYRKNYKKFFKEYFIAKKYKSC